MSQGTRTVGSGQDCCSKRFYMSCSILLIYQALPDTVSVACSCAQSLAFHALALWSHLSVRQNFGEIAAPSRLQCSIFYILLYL